MNFSQTEKYLHLIKVNQIKTIEDQGIKQVEASKSLKPEKIQELEPIEGLFPKHMRNKEIKNEKDEIKK